jgi:RND family efflux transporter MFP subunit
MDRKIVMTNKQIRALAGAAVLAIGLAQGTAAAPAALATVPVASASGSAPASFEAVVEAVRQTVVAAQVAGSVAEIRVKAGDAVHAGQVLIRLDARAAEQTAASADAQVQAARASLDVATQDLERKKQLLKKNYISQAAFERAQAQFTATQAQVSAQLAQAGAAHTQSGFYLVQAPYAGVVAEVPVALGDMAMPGRPLVSLYDPLALRVTASVAQTAVGGIADTKGVKVEIPGLAAGHQWLVPSHVQVLPTVDPGTHTVDVRMDLPRDTRGVSPGMFARAWLPTLPMQAQSPPGGPAASAAPRLFVPVRSIVRRAELMALYVVDEGGRPILRQVRLGERIDDNIEVLSGVSAGEIVALDPQAAARVQ